MNRASVLSSIRDSRNAGNLWRMMRGVGGARKSKHQSWLAKGLGLGLGLLCWGSKGVKRVIPSEDASTLRVSGISTRTMHQSTTPSLSEFISPRWALRQFLTLPIDHVFVAASHQTRLDTRSKARRPIKVGIKGRRRSGRSRDSNPACLCC